MNQKVTQGHLGTNLRYQIGQYTILSNYLRSSLEMEGGGSRSCGLSGTDIRDYWREVIIPHHKHK
jgi:hypothetical protein